MKLYYSPGACSLADHIALNEAGLPYELVKVDLKAKTTETGEDYRQINPKGYVPALQLDDGAVLTENIAVLGYIADRAGKPAPADGLSHWRVLEMTAFISTELHKSFGPIFKGASPEEQEKAKAAIMTRLGEVDQMLGERDFIVGDELSVADCYLFVMLTWAAGKARLAVPGRLAAYRARLAARSGFADALKAEGLS